jgi:hypothetical protein
MAANAMFMIHEPSGVAVGTAEDMLRTATLLESISKNVVETYAARTGRDKAQIKAEMQAETWFTAEQAKEAGYVTHVAPRKQMTAHFDMSAQFGSAPAWVRERLAELKGGNMPTSPEKTKEAEDAKPEQAVDIAAIQQKAAKDAADAATARATEISAKCQLAGFPGKASEFIANQSMSPADVADELLKMVCKKNAPTDCGGDPLKDQADPNAKYSQEYNATPETQARMTLADYQSLRRFQDGLEPLIPGKK